MIVPGHGRISDEADLVEYRDMVTIIRDRVQDMVNRGMTLAQVQAAKPTMEYDGLYGSARGLVQRAVRGGHLPRPQTPAGLARRSEQASLAEFLFQRLPWLEPALWTALTIGGAYLLGHLINLIVSGRLTRWAGATQGKWDDVLVRDADLAHPLVERAGRRMAVAGLLADHRALAPAGLAHDLRARRPVGDHGRGRRGRESRGGLRDRARCPAATVSGADPERRPAAGRHVRPAGGAERAGRRDPADAGRPGRRRPGGGAGAAGAVVESLCRPVHHHGRPDSHRRLRASWTPGSKAGWWISTGAPRRSRSARASRVVPNVKLAQAIVTNHNLPTPEVNVPVDFVVDYASDAQAVEALVLARGARGAGVRPKAP